MKRKFLALSLSALMCLSALTLSACNENPKSYEINVRTYNQLLGSVELKNGNGFDGLFKQNSTVTIKASPVSTSAFLAWVKDDEEIVSYSAEYSFTANSNTKGKYTALFQTKNIEFVKISSIEYQLSSFRLEDDDYEAIIKSWELTYNTSPDLHKKLASTSNFSLEQDNNNIITSEPESEKIFYFDKEYYFILNLDIEYTNKITQQKTTEPLQTIFSAVDFSNILDCEPITTALETVRTYDEDGVNYTLTLTTANDGKQTLKLEYNALSSSSLWDTDSELEYSQQSFSIEFSYPIT